MRAGAPQDMLHGRPVKLGQGWVVLRVVHGGEFWFPLLHTVGHRRRDAIEALERVSGRGSYAKMRRRGEVLAVWCVLDPILAGHPPGLP